MRAEPTCPRCGGRLSAPGIWSSDWTCGVHGAVLPRQPSWRPGPEGLAALLGDVRVPAWLPWPLPQGWLVTGFAAVGDERTGGRASAVALSGPGLRSGPADMILIAEEPGIGLGAHYAGLDGPDPGGGLDGPPSAKLDIQGPTATNGHTVPMWTVATRDDRAVHVGEALAHWLWVVMWPSEACLLMSDRLHLIDLREPGMELDLPYGAFSPRLDAPDPA